jgi:hypothetical protein
VCQKENPSWQNADSEAFVVMVSNVPRPHCNVIENKKCKAALNI